MQVHLLARQVVQFGDIAERHLAVAVAQDGKTNGVGGAVLWKTRAVARVSEIAALLQLFIGGNGMVAPRCSALATIACTKRKPRWMLESGVVEALGGDEIGAGHAGRFYSRKRTNRSTVFPQEASKMISMICRFLPILLLSCSTAAQVATQNINTELSKLKGTVVVMRTPYSGNRLEFSSDGRFIHGGKPGRFLNSALIKINSIENRAMKLIVKGQRCLAVYDIPAGSLKAAPLPSNVEVQVANDGSSLETVLTSVFSVFETQNVAEQLKNFWVPSFDMSARIPPAARAANSPVGTIAGRPVYLVRPGAVTPPKIVRAQDPHYPEGERSAGQGGRTMLYMVVDENGDPAMLGLKSTPVDEFDLNSLATVSDWKFVPAFKDRQPVPVLINVEVNFHP